MVYIPSLGANEVIGIDGCFCAWSPKGNNVYGNFKQLYLLKQQNRQLKVCLSIGGGGATGFENMNDASYRSTFVKTAVQMVSDYGLDCLDIDWEYPTDDTIENYYHLLNDTRAALDDLAAKTSTTPFLLSIAVPGGGGAAAPYEKYIPQIDAVVDYYNCMFYDL